jgi:hypothetical protein
LLDQFLARPAAAALQASESIAAARGSGRLTNRLPVVSVKVKAWTLLAGAVQTSPSSVKVSMQVLPPKTTLVRSPASPAAQQASKPREETGGNKTAVTPGRDRGGWKASDY